MFIGNDPRSSNDSKPLLTMSRTIRTTSTMNAKVETLFLSWTNPKGTPRKPSCYTIHRAFWRSFNSTQTEMFIPEEQAFVASATTTNETSNVYCMTSNRILSPRSLYHGGISYAVRQILFLNMKTYQNQIRWCNKTVHFE